MSSTSTSIARIRENRNQVWDVNTQSWVAMTQPLVEAGSVTIPGTVTVADGGGSLTVDVGAGVANTSVTGTIDALNEEVTIDVPSGCNSVTAIITPTSPIMTLVFMQGSFATAFSSGAQAYDFQTGTWLASLGLTAGSGRRVLSIPVVSNTKFSILSAAYTSGSISIELIASTSVALGTPLTNIELRASSLVVNTELNTAAALSDNQANPTTANVGANNLIWDGSTWDRAPGNSTDGLLVNLGANNDVTVTGTPLVKEIRAGTPSQSSVQDTASPTTLLASNAARLGATITNDSSGILYVKLGAGASTTSYTKRMLQYDYYEVPFGYTGIIDGIWFTDPNDGAARITELT